MLRLVEVQHRLGVVVVVFLVCACLPNALVVGPQPDCSLVYFAIRVTRQLQAYVRLQQKSILIPMYTLVDEKLGDLRKLAQR